MVMSWIDSESNPLERFFWTSVLIASGVSEIANPSGLLSIFLSAVPLIAAFIVAALDYIDPDKDVGSATF